MKQLKQWRPKASEQEGPLRSDKNVYLLDAVGDESKEQTNYWSHPHLSKPVNYPTDREHPNYGLRRITQQDGSKLRFHREILAHGSNWPPKKMGHLAETLAGLKI